ncbi:MAG: hypothetical protein QOF86_1397, partial [Baekduia sp.]|nr:hypothetical protein [Baekduia sp.]
PRRRAELGDAARRRFVEEFGADRWAQRLRDVYDDAVTARGR